MHRPKSVILAALALLLASGSAKAAIKDWTVMYYAVTDERTSDDYGRELGAVAKRVTNPEAVNVVLQWDTHDKAVRRRVVQDRKWVKADPPASDNMGDPATLFRFLEWAVTAYPARRYVLFLAGHGSGWESKKGPGSIKDRARTTEWVRKALIDAVGPAADGRTYDTKGTCYDYDDHDCLTLQESRVVLEEISRRHLGGRKLDLLVLKSCWQMNLETVFEHQDAARYVVGCETTAFCGTNIFYDLFSKLCADPGIDARDLGRSLIEGYMNSSSSAKTVALFDTDGIDEVTAGIDRLAFELLRVLRHPKRHGAEGSNFRSVLFTDKEHHEGDERFIDLTTVCHNVASGKTGFRVTPEIEAAAADLRAAMGKHMNCWRRAPYADYKSMCISVWLPKQQKNWQTFREQFDQLRIAEETHWDEYLHLRKGRGYDHERALLADLRRLAGWTRRRETLERALADLPADCAARTLAEREARRLAFLATHLTRLLADETVLEVAEEDGQGLKDLSRACAGLARDDKASMKRIFQDASRAIRSAVRDLAGSDPDRAAALEPFLNELP